MMIIAFPVRVVRQTETATATANGDTAQTNGRTKTDLMHRTEEGAEPTFNLSSMGESSRSKVGLVAMWPHL